MKLSVIVPTYNRPRDLDNLLRSIVEQTRLPQEVIVVDQSEGDETKVLLESYEGARRDSGPRFIWHHQKEKSSAKARNAGFRLSRAEIICFTDDDIVFDRNYLENVSAYFDSNPEVGGISGNVLVTDPPHGIKWAIRESMMKLFLISFMDGRMTPSGFGFPLFLHEIKEVTPVELFAGYSMNWRRRYFEENQFDEWFMGYSFREDVELSYRISRRTRLVMIPQARFVHNHSSTNRLGLRKLKEMQVRNYYYVFKKHHGKSPLSRLLFGYSMMGLLCMSFIEFVLGFRKSKWDAFSADCLAIVELLKP